MSAAPNPNHAAQPPSSGAFVEPQNRTEFNKFIVDHTVAKALTSSEFHLLKEKVTRVELTRALIAVHSGGQNRTRATDWLNVRFTRVIQLVAGGERAVADVPQQRNGEPFVEPNTLRAINDFFGKHQLNLALTQPELDALLRNTGRVALMKAIKGIHEQGDSRAVAEETLRASVSDAKVRVARGEGAPQQRSAAEELPPDTGGDAGFEGTPTGRAPAQEPRGQFGGQQRTQNQRPAQQAQQGQQGQQNGRTSGAAPPRQRSEPSSDTCGDSQREYSPQARAYGTKAALNIEAITSRQGEATLRVEMAPAKPNVQKVYEWQKKIVFDMMRREVLEFLAVLHGWAPGAKFQYHGPTHAKWFQIVNQGEKVYISMGDKDAPLLGIPVAEFDTLTDMLALAVKQACLTYHDIASGDLLRFVQLRIAPHIKAVPGRT